MQLIRTDSDVIRILRVAIVLWLGYLFGLSIIDYLIKTPGPVEHFFYIVNTAVGLFFLGIAFCPWIRRWLVKVFAPLIIVLSCALPIIINQFVIRYLFINERLVPPEAMSYRILPFLFIALALMAWQYKWRHVLLFSLGVAVLNIGIFWFFAPPVGYAFKTGLFVVLTQTVSFIMVGFFIGILVGRLRGQQRSLEEANLQLNHYVSILDNLATSRERERLAREIHDTLAHTISALVVQLETMKAYIDVDLPTVRAILEQSLAASRSGLEDTRRAVKALRPVPLDDLGLVSALRRMAEELAARASLTLDLSIADEMTALSLDVEQCVYRVAQEAIINVINHARANTLTVKLEYKNGKVMLMVRDDGVGFDAKRSDEASNFGLIGMKERARFAGGELNITSQPGHGTTVQLTI